MGKLIESLGGKRRIAIALLVVAQMLPLLDVPDAQGWAGVLTSVAVILGGADILQAVKTGK